MYTGLEKSTRPLVFTSASGCRASETLDDFQCKLTFFSIYANYFCDAGQVPILRYFKACVQPHEMTIFFNFHTALHEARAQNDTHIHTIALGKRL